MHTKAYCMLFAVLERISLHIRVGKKRKGRGFGSSMLSEPLAAFMGKDRAPRNEV